MNLIPKIAEMLGVEIGEEFKIAPQDGENDVIENNLFRFSESNLEINRTGISGNDNWNGCFYFLDVVRGDYKIVKAPFEPKIGEHYYWCDVNNDGEMITCCSLWGNGWHELHFKSVGNCFRTRAEAEAHKYEIYEKLTVKKWGKEDGDNT